MRGKKIGDDFDYPPDMGIFINAPGFIYQGHLRCDLLSKWSFLHCVAPSDSPAYEDETLGPGR